MTIKNFGIIENISIDFSKGLNILTGETGAGKSILIDALRLCLGERFQSSYLRDNSESCTVEAVFDFPAKIRKTISILEDFPGEDNTFIIQRHVNADGKNRIKINGLVASVAQLKEIGDALIDFHGPHDHQQLLAQRQHLMIIDALTDFKTTFKDYTKEYQQYVALRTKLRELDTLAQSRDRDLDLLEHQIRELEQVPLDESHLEELERDRVKINNAEKLYQHISQAMAILENEEVSLEVLLSKTFKPLNSLSDIDEKAAPLVDQLSTLKDNARTLLSDLRSYADSLSFDAGYAKTVNDQVDAYADIKRKYGATLDEAMKFYEDAKEKFSLLSTFEQNKEELITEIKDAETKLNKIAKAITHERKKTADLLKKTIEKELQELGFKAVVFEARLEKKALFSDGADDVVFYISTNAGESLKPLADIISSGEAARLMLAIKRALMKVDPVPVLIFDEIDAQIGGRLGTVIGKKLKEVAEHRQVLLITHLPQIAAFAETHLKIAKIVDKGRTKTTVEPLTAKSKVNELAHMMAGDAMTEAALKHAREMIKEAEKYS